MIFNNKNLSFKIPKVMGILNVTPDSFSDGGAFKQLDAALRQTEQMLSQGASFIDVGGESTRPGAQDVSEQEELDRV
ncbi:MAG: dihydropteroate synthase, partial [Paraglaciecola sp.]